MSLQQNANDPDGKTFGSKAPERSPEFGVAAADAKVNPGAIPGGKQTPAPVFSPENG